jgi:hypothetical protein
LKYPWSPQSSFHAKKKQEKSSIIN